MAYLKYGSKGDEVKQLQQALINAGYDVGSSGADGNYGPATQAAVTQYQKDKGLKVDGLAGTETQGSLYSSGSNTTGGAAANQNSGWTPADVSGNNYSQLANMSDIHQAALEAAGKSWQAANAAGDQAAMDAAHEQAEAIRALYGYSGGADGSQYIPKNKTDELYAMLEQLQAQMSQPIQSYTPSWGDQAYEDLLQQAISMNYDDWTNSDQYKSLADRFGSQGKMTMQDVLGQISSRTGGLASSYATTAAQQQYNEHMSQLEEVARQMFAGERGDLIENAGLARDYGELEYGRYLDQLNMQNDRNSYALDIINQMMGYQQDKANTQYAQGQDSKAEAQDRINAFLAAYGSAANLDPALVRASGYTQGELETIERYYADQKAKEAASGGGSADIYQTMYDNGVKSEGTAYSWLLSNGYNSTQAGKLAGYFAEWLDDNAEPEKEPEQASTQSGTAPYPHSTYGTSYNTAWGQARKMYDSGKSDDEIMAYLDQFSEDRLTEEGLRYIMSSLNLGGYRE